MKTYLITGLDMALNVRRAFLRITATSTEAALKAAAERVARDGEDHFVDLHAGA